MVFFGVFYRFLLQCIVLNVFLQFSSMYLSSFGEIFWKIQRIVGKV